MPYATKDDVEAMVGYTIDDTGDRRPSLTYLNKMLRRADQIINAEMHVDHNILVERSKVVCSAKSSLSGSEYFYFYITDSNNSEDQHYVWYDVNGGDTDPDKNGTGHEVDISSVSTAAEVANETASTINDISGISAYNDLETVYIENDDMYDATDTEDGDTGFTFTTLQDGTADSGGLKNIALELIYNQINNMFAISNPDKFAPKEIELTSDHIRTIHKTYYKWEGDTFELDGR